MCCRLIYSLLILSITVFTAFPGKAQDSTLATTKLQAGFYKDQSGARHIGAKLLKKIEKYAPFANAELQFYVLHDTSSTLLQTVVTDEKGEAICMLDESVTPDSTGIMAFRITFAGDATAEGDDKEIQVMPAELKVAFFQEDTSKFISVEAMSPDATGGMTPVPELEIGVYVKGTFSYFSIAKDVTDANGKLIVPFPVTMPGDSLGVVTIAAKVEDNDIYGNVESWGTINWARPVPVVAEARRGLGDTDAPLWMVYTLIVLLSAVWFHYAYVIFLIIKIKLAKHHT